MKHLRYLLMAALVAMPLTACDEDDDPVIEPEIFGTVTGTVSAEGTGLANVSVTLVGAMTESTTTAAGGSYTFTNVKEGSYGISIDASAHSDVSFPVTSKTTSIVASGETKTVDFSEGSYIRTAAITGVVSASGAPLAGVAVNIAGGADAVDLDKVTDAAGAYVASGLRAGDYTVTIDAPAGINFATTTQNVSVATGETVNAGFPGEAVELATITGAVTVDGVGVVDVLVTLSGDADATTETGAGGAYSFVNLDPGTYLVTITPPEGTVFEEMSQEVIVGAGETGVASFAGTGPLEAATISIKSITRNDDGAVVPVDLDNVFDQIEVTLNITRNDDELEYVDIVFTHVATGEEIIVATQVFQAPAAAAALTDIEETTLSVQTTQVERGTTTWQTVAGATATTWVPVIINGGWTVGAELFVVGEDQPIPTDKKPIVVQNEDMFLPGGDFGGNIDYMPEEPDRNADNVSTGDTWYAGDAFAQGWVWLSYTNRMITDFDFDLEVDQFANDIEPDEILIIGDADAGAALYAHYDLSGATRPAVENADVELDWDDIDDVTYPPVVGPDGTPLNYNSNIAALSTIFELHPWAPIGERAYIIHPEDVQENQILEPPEYNWDNVGPTVTVDDGVLPGEPKVAFKDYFDEAWVNADYTFVLFDDDGDLSPDGDVWATDAGVGLNHPATSALDMDWNDTWDDRTDDVCTSDVKVTGADYTETLASDGTPDGWIICGMAKDLLDNTGYSDGSNFFGVDFVDPLIRAYDELGDGTGEISPDVNTLNGTIFTDDPLGNGDFASYDTDYRWAFEALDGRSGFDESNYYDGSGVALDGTQDPFIDMDGDGEFTFPGELNVFPAYQNLTHYPGLGAAPIDCGDFTNDLTPIGGMDPYTRTNPVVDFTCLADLVEPGYFAYLHMVTDRAGNMAWLGSGYPTMHDPVSYAVDDVGTGGAAPTWNLFQFVNGFYYAGQPAGFEIYAEDDLEVIEADIGLVHPYGAAPGAITVRYGFGAIDAFARFDGFDPMDVDPWDLFDADLFSSAAIGEIHQTPLPVFGRLDGVCTGLGAPLGNCLEDHGVSDVAAEYNFGDTDVDRLPQEATAWVRDVGYNSTALSATITNIAFIDAQWANSQAAPWSEIAEGTTEVIIRRWYITEVTAGSAYTATMEAPTSIEVPFFGEDGKTPQEYSGVYLVNFDIVSGELLICGEMTYDEDWDNGVDRFFDYSGNVPAGNVCEGATGTWHAIGVKGDGKAGLITQGL